LAGGQSAWGARGWAGGGELGVAVAWLGGGELGVAVAGLGVSQQRVSSHLTGGQSGRVTGGQSGKVGRVTCGRPGTGRPGAPAESSLAPLCSPASPTSLVLPRISSDTRWVPHRTYSHKYGVAPIGLTGERSCGVEFPLAPLCSPASPVPSVLPRISSDTSGCDTVPTRGAQLRITCSLIMV
jgi:hypothetical protein